MGCSTTTCMASGMPIIPGSEAVILFVGVNNRIERFSHEPDDRFQFVSFPMFVTMGDYGIGEQIEGDEIKEQLAWRLFEPLLTRKKRESDSGLLIDMNFGKLQFLLEPVMPTCYRKDVWDRLCAMTGTECMGNFEKHVREAFAEEWRTTLPRCEFIHWKYHAKMLRAKHEQEPSLSPEQIEELVGFLLQMRAFCYGLEIIGQPIIPETELSSQGGWDSPHYKQMAEFRRFCADTILEGVRKRKRELGY